MRRNKDATDTRELGEKESSNPLQKVGRDAMAEQLVNVNVSLKLKVGEDFLEEFI